MRRGRENGSTTLKQQKETCTEGTEVAAETVGAKKDPLLGQTFKEYRIEKKLGAGAMGSVYEAEHVATGRRVAVKVMSPATNDRPEDAATRFADEAVVLGKLNHPGIVKVIDYATLEDGRPVIVMDLVPGISLGAYTDRHQQLDPSLVVRIIVALCGALQAAHDKGILHRDIKPENVMLLLDDEVHVTILDFGIARWRGKGSGLTTVGAVMGTPLFMSPEQLQGEDIDARSDLYGLAALAFNLLCGQPPFSGETMAVVGQHLGKKPPTFKSFDVTNAEALKLEPVIRRALAKKRTDRQASVREFGRELASAAGLLSLINDRKPEQTSVLGTRAPVDKDASTVELAAVGTTRQRMASLMRGGKAKVVVGGLGVLAALVALAMLFHSPSHPPTPRVVTSSNDAAITHISFDASAPPPPIVTPPPMEPVDAGDAADGDEDAGATATVATTTEDAGTPRISRNGRQPSAPNCERRRRCAAGSLTTYNVRLRCRASCVAGCWTCD